MPKCIAADRQFNDMHHGLVIDGLLEVRNPFA
jgi:hypothetical protein